MSKILLVHPEISRTKYNFVGVIENECLELEYISAILKEKGNEVYIYDGQIETAGIPYTLEKVKPELVYVCGRTRQENFMIEYCIDSKNFNKDIVTVIGGLHAQLCYERMYNDNVDYILKTFDVFKILDIIDFAISKKEVDLSQVDGICYKTNGNWQSNVVQPFDINRLPLPDRTYFDEHPNRYRYLDLEHSAWVRTAYCCPYKCSFCHRNKMNSGKYSTRNIEDVVNEIGQIKADNIYIVDDDFLFDIERLTQFAELIKSKNIKKKFICYGRADFISKNREIMIKLKEIGLYYVLVGLESIENKYLNDYNKKTNVDTNIETIKICQELDINLMAMFIVDLDYTPKDFKKLYKWIKAHSLRHIAVSIFTPELDTDVYDLYKDRILTDNAEHWDYLHLVAKPSEISVKKYYFHYYILMIKLFLRSKRMGVYDFIDYGDYIKSLIKNIFKKEYENI